MTATDELRALLDERGVSYYINIDGVTEWESSEGDYSSAVDLGDGRLVFTGCLTPIGAIEVTLGRGTCRKVYLVETSDDLLESWYPVAVYLHRESAEDCAEALRKEEDGIRQFARVSELRVVDG